MKDWLIFNALLDYLRLLSQLFCESLRFLDKSFLHFVGKWIMIYVIEFFDWNKVLELKGVLERRVAVKLPLEYHSNCLHFFLLISMYHFSKFNWLGPYMLVDVVPVCKG